MNRLPTPDEMPEPLAGLMRDHKYVEALFTDVRAIFDGAVIPGLRKDAAAHLIQTARSLQRYLARDLTLHIAKEEDVLFPALRSLADDMDDMDDAILHMVAQHDEIRARQDLIDRTMAALDAHDHHEVDQGREAFIAQVEQAPAALTPEWLAELQERAMRLERILLGHFADEEEDLFVPAVSLIPPDVMEQLTADMAALERAAPPA